MLLGVLLGLAFALAIASIVSAPVSLPRPPDAAADSATLQDAKLWREIAQLERDLQWSSRTLQAIGPVLVAIVGALATYIVSRRLNALTAAENASRVAAEQAEETRRLAAAEEVERFSTLTPERVQAYALAFEKLSPTAIFFPGPSTPDELPQEPAAGPDQANFAAAPGAPDPRLSRADCAKMGTELSRWYFGAGGLLLTERSRDAYFALLEALRLASNTPLDKKLAVPTMKEGSEKISNELIKSYRDELAKNHSGIFEKLKNKTPVKDGDVAKWHFGPSADGTGDAEKFRDFVLIQQLASRLRTELTNDIRSRKAPGAE